MSDPLETLAIGATKGFLEHWEEKLPGFITRLRNREIAFVEDRKNFDVVVSEGASSEFKLFRQFAPKGWPCILFKMGLALRVIEKEQDRVKAIKDDIYRKFGKRGVHIAELAQRGILTQLVAQLAKIMQNPVDVCTKLTNLLENVDEVTIFVTEKDAAHIEGLCNRVKNKVDNSQPHLVIIFGSGFAMDVVLKILKRVGKDPEGYAIMLQQDWPQVIGFVFAPEMKGKLKHWTEPFTKE